MSKIPTQHSLTPLIWQSHPLKVEGWRKFLVDFKYLLLEQVKIMQANWVWYLMVSLFLPLALVFGFGHIGNTIMSRDTLLYIVSGSAIVSAATEALANLATRIANLKSQGRIIYYASLPISKIAFVMALITSRWIVTLLGMVVPIIVGPLLYNIQFEYSLWIVVIVFLTGFSLATVGLALGVIMGSPEITSMLGNLLLILLLLASPIFTPVSNLILPLQLLGYLLPPTYAAQALRYALVGDYNLSFYLDLALLTAFMLLGFYLTSKCIRWRIN